MIPYELVVTSAARPDLLRPTLESLLRRVDQPPARVVVHDDAVAYGPHCDRWPGMKRMLAELDLPCQLLVHHADPPRRLGLAINWLLANVSTEYVLYSQDDFVTVRDVPLRRALATVHDFGLHHVRFNKRATMAFKETWEGRWDKVEQSFGPEVLTVSDHWYFQLGLWRVSEMRRALAFWTASEARARKLALDEPEGVLNYYFDHVAYGGDPADPRVRAACQRTFIWGPIGEDRYIRHIGGDPGDWAGNHARTGGVDDAATAWREIASYGADVNRSRRTEPTR